MSVYTSVDQTQLETFLQSYNLGGAVSLEGITNGITNSNYRLTTETGQYILTLFEVTGTRELEFALELQQFLRASGVAVAAAIDDRQGRKFSPLNSRSAAIIEFLAGDYCLDPGLDKIGLVARELASFHEVTFNYSRSSTNIRGVDWCYTMKDRLGVHLSKDDVDLIENAIQNFSEISKYDLPHCAIHADLFRDNVLFDGEQLSGFIDFDYACTDTAILDIAVTVNDWCLDKKSQIDPYKLSTFIDAYQSIRVLTNLEKVSLADAMQFAATRFWLSRLYDWHFPMSGSLTFSKDPDEFKRLLIELRDPGRYLAW